MKSILYALLLPVSVLAGEVKGPKDWGFRLSAIGEVHGCIGQIGDGQLRLADSSLPPTTFYINGDRRIIDSQGRRCYLTKDILQFQCDESFTETKNRFTVNPDGLLEYGGDLHFYACPATDTTYNVYSEPVQDQMKCVTLTLSTVHGDCSGVTPGGAPSSLLGQVLSSASQSPSSIASAASSPAPCPYSSAPGTPASCAPGPSAPTPCPYSSAPGTPGPCTGGPPSSVPTPSVPGGCASSSSDTPGSPCSAPASSAPTPSAPSYPSSAPTPSAPNYPSSSPLPGGPPPCASSESAPCLASTPVPSEPTSSVPESSVASSTEPSGTPPASYPSASACPASLSNPYEYPHLIVPVCSSSPNTAYGTQYHATINSTTSVIFNFDIPASWAGMTCSVVFMFPQRAELETSDYDFSGQGNLVFTNLSGAATLQTSWASAPPDAGQLGSVALQPGSSYSVAYGRCPAGSSLSTKLSASDGLELAFFQDYNPAPIGCYVTAC